MKKSQNKALLLSLCAVLLVAASVFGTLAYLTDQESVTNTFTVGSVTLGDGTLEKGLDEALVDEYGNPIDKEDGGTKVDLDKAPRVQANDYKLVPGHNYTKDPTVHVKNDSEDSYIFVKVENGIADIEAATENTEGGYKKITDQVTANGWQQLTDVDDNNVSNVYWKKWTKGTNTTGTTDLLVFSEFEIAGENVTADTLKNYTNNKIVVTAYAIQTGGFDTAIKAWEAGNFN